jgi:hypothetical protein
VHWPTGIFPVCQTQDILPILFWSFLLLALVVLMFLAVIYLKKWLASDDPTSGGFTLGDLRRMKASGQMNDEEYEKAKLQIVGAVKLAAEKMGAPAKPVAAASKPFPIKPASTGPTIPRDSTPLPQTKPPPPTSNAQDSQSPPQPPGV